MCASCGETNRRNRLTTCDLAGRVAIVTGARIGIGYAVALRLLRAGATVLATSRFTHDAARRFAAEPDFAEWSARLRLHRLDLRHVPDVEAWAREQNGTLPRLDLLINNAAQTIRRPSGFYAHLTESEASPAELPQAARALLAFPHSTSDTPLSMLPVFASNTPAIPERLRLLDTPPRIPFPESAPELAASFQTDRERFPAGQLTPDGQQLDLSLVNSWLLRDDEISALELIEVHVINAVAPFLLLSRLKERLVKTATQTGRAYAVNVSSSEGRFGGTKKKPWRHPHTNMAKAALHMMTYTCASDYARFRIYLNAVDPGWVSYQHPHRQQVEMQVRGTRPTLTLDDGAARVCHPVWTGENEAHFLSGKLLKDFVPVEW